MATRSVLTFACPACQRTFQVPESAIPPEGARGRCRGCGAQMAVFLDGHADLLAAPPAPAAAPAPPPAPEPPAAPAEERIWYLRFQRHQEELGPGPYTLSEIRDMILEEQALEEDLGRVSMGPWMPLRAYPALESFWAERNRTHRHYHGDPEHCAVHAESTPGWLCPKCRSYLCADCVENSPIVEGGAPRMLCMACEFEARPLTDAGIAKKKGLGGLFKR